MIVAGPGFGARKPLDGERDQEISPIVLGAREMLAAASGSLAWTHRMDNLDLDLDLD